MLPRTLVVPRPPACTELLTPAQSYQRPSSPAREQDKSALRSSAQSLAPLSGATIVQVVEKPHFVPDGRARVVWSAGPPLGSEFTDESLCSTTIVRATGCRR